MMERPIHKWLIVVFLVSGFVGMSASAGQSRDGAKANSEPVASTTCDDATIAANVKEVLSKELSLCGQRINVEVKDGIVKLTGYVCNESLQSLAKGVINTVDCVKKVDNEISLGEFRGKRCALAPRRAVVAMVRGNARARGWLVAGVASSSRKQ